MGRLLVLLAVTLLVACSSGGKHNPQEPPSTTTSSTSTSSPSTSSTSPTSSTPSTSVPAKSSITTTTTTGGFSGSARITGFSLVGASPVACNAPTTIELRWKSAGAQKVEMHIDGGSAFTRYGNGTFDEYLPIECDGKSHTYTLVATSAGATLERSVIVSTKRTA